MNKLIIIASFALMIAMPSKANSNSELKAEYAALLLTIALELYEGAKVPAHKTLIDCNDPNYKPTASHKSLFSWSNRHHKDAKSAIEAFNENPVDNTAKYAGMRACKSAIRMRGAAHCMKPGNNNYKNAFTQSVMLCKGLK